MMIYKDTIDAYESMRKNKKEDLKNVMVLRHKLKALDNLGQ